MSDTSSPVFTFTPRILHCEDIQLLEQGATLERVIEACGPLPASGVPIYRFSKGGGGYYIFCFFPTNETKLDLIGRYRDGYCLWAILKCDVDNEGLSNAIYIIPDRLRGQRCTGFP